jgi:hypothetical protein
MATLVKYWPAVVAGLYLAYVVAAGNSAQVGPATIALLTALGLNAQAQSAHAKIEALR